jgi:hypothetical protein
MTDSDKIIMSLLARQRVKSLVEELSALVPYLDEPDPRPPEKPIKRRKLP